MKLMKCPVCWNYGNEVEKDTFMCKRCGISFNQFYISSSDGEIEEERFLN